MPMANNNFIVLFCFLLYVKTPDLQWQTNKQQSFIVAWCSGVVNGKAGAATAHSEQQIHQLSFALLDS